jgi:hypothetical protein
LLILFGSLLSCHWSLAEITCYGGLAALATELQKFDFRCETFHFISPTNLSRF